MWISKVNIFILCFMIGSEQNRWNRGLFTMYDMQTPLPLKSEHFEEFCSVRSYTFQNTFNTKKSRHEKICIFFEKYDHIFFVRFEWNFQTILRTKKKPPKVKNNFGRKSDFFQFYFEGDLPPPPLTPPTELRPWTPHALGLTLSLEQVLAQRHWLWLPAAFLLTIFFSCGDFFSLKIVWFVSSESFIRIARKFF